MTFLSKSVSSLNVVNISWAMSMRCCFCSKFSKFGTIFATALFMPQTSIKIAWHELNNKPASSASSLIQIRQLSKIIFLHWFNVFIGCWRARAPTLGIVIESFSDFHRFLTFLSNQDNHCHWHLLLIPVKPQLNLCSAHCRLAKCHSQHLDIWSWHI